MTKTDKSNGIVITKNSDYDNKINDFITSNQFKTLNEDPTEEYSKVTNTAINKCKTISKITQNQLKVIKPKAPTLHGLPKLHKENIPLRPVVNYKNAPTYKLCGFLHRKIKRT